MNFTQFVAGLLHSAAVETDRPKELTPSEFGTACRTLRELAYPDAKRWDAGYERGSSRQVLVFGSLPRRK